MKKDVVFVGTMLLILFLGSMYAFASGDQESDTVVLKVGLQDQPGSIPHQGIEEFKSELESLSNNTITVEIFPSSQLGDYKAMTGQVSAGELDMVLTGYPDMSFMVPAFEVIGEPYVITNYEQLFKAIDTDFVQSLHKELEEKNIKYLNVWYTGARQVTSNRPLNSIEDFKGLKLRTPNVPFLIHFAEAVGAVPTPIAFQEVYLALQTNQVEAEENPLTTIEVMKFYEVQKYIAMTSHFIATTGIWINNDLWNRLSAAQQDMIMSALEKGRELNNTLAREDERTLIEKFEEKGIIFTYPDITPMQQAMEPYYDELNNKYENYGQNIVQKIKDIK